jgi:hypothetical protein
MANDVFQDWAHSHSLKIVLLFEEIVLALSTIFFARTLTILSLGCVHSLFFLLQWIVPADSLVV